MYLYRIAKKKPWPCDQGFLSRAMSKLELDACVELDPSGTATGVELAEVGVSDGKRLEVPAVTVECICPGRTDLEELSFTPKGKSLADTEILAE